MVEFTSMRSALNHYAMGDIELPDEASAVQEMRKLRSKKLGNIERRLTKIKKKSGRLGSTGGGSPTSDLESAFSDGLELPETPIDEYNFTHVIAATTIASVMRGAYARTILSRWKRLSIF